VLKDHGDRSAAVTEVIDKYAIELAKAIAARPVRVDLKPSDGRLFLTSGDALGRFTEDSPAFPVRPALSRDVRFDELETCRS